MKASTILTTLTMLGVAAAAAVTPVSRALAPRQSATLDFCCPAEDATPEGVMGFVLDPNTSFPQCGYIAEGAPPGNYEQDAGFEGGTAGGCLYNDDGTLQQDRNAGFCPQSAVSCTVAKRDFARRKLAAQRPSAKMVRSEMSDELVAKRGV